MGVKARNPIKSVQRAVRIVETLAEHGSCGVTTLADELGLSKGTVSNHLATLEELGYVVRTDSVYRVGLQFLRLGHIARSYHSVASLAKSHVSEVAKASGGYGTLVVQDGDYGAYAYVSHGSEEGPSDQIRPGDRLPLHCTAAGKAIFAYLSDSEARNIWNRYDRVQLTDRTITDWNELQEELQTVREQGIAFDRGERRTDFCGVAAPILSADEKVLGAVGVTGPKSKIGGKSLQQDTAGLVVSVAQRLSRSVGESRSPI